MTKPEGPSAETKVDARVGLPCLGPSLKEAGQRPLARETPAPNGLGHRSGLCARAPTEGPRSSQEKPWGCKRNSAGDGTQSQTAARLPPALPPDPAARPEGVPSGVGGEGGPAIPAPPPGSSAGGPAGAAAGAHPRRPRWSLLRARGAGALPKHILTECLQTGCPGRAFNCTCFFILSFFFLIFFTKKRFYTSNIYMDFYNHSM